MIYWALVYDAIEFVSTLLFFKLFIYEEISQAGSMYCFILQNNLGVSNVEKIKDLTKIHGIEPGKEANAKYWLLAPWVTEGFYLFFLAAEQSVDAW